MFETYSALPVWARRVLGGILALVALATNCKPAAAQTAPADRQATATADAWKASEAIEAILSASTDVEYTLKWTSDSFSERLSAVAVAESTPQAAACDTNGLCRVFDLNTGKVLAELRETGSDVKGPARAVGLSPDGKHVAIGWEVGGVRVWDVATRKPVFTYKAPRGSVSYVRVTSDGQSLAVFSQDPAWHLTPLLSGGARVETVAAKGKVGSYAASPDGRQFAYSDESNQLLLGAFGDGQKAGAREEYGALAPAHRLVVFSSRFVGFHGPHQRFHLREFGGASADSQLRIQFPTRLAQPKHLWISQDSKALLALSADGQIDFRGLAILQNTYGGAIPLGESDLAFATPDLQRLVVGRGSQVELLQMEAPPELPRERLIRLAGEKLRSGQYEHLAELAVHLAQASLTMPATTRTARAGEMLNVLRSQIAGARVKDEALAAYVREHAESPLAKLVENSFSVASVAGKSPTAGVDWKPGKLPGDSPTNAANLNRTPAPESELELLGKLLAEPWLWRLEQQLVFGEDGEGRISLAEKAPRAAIGRINGTCLVFDVQTGKRLKPPELAKPNARAMLASCALSPDGTLLAVGWSEGGIHVYDLEGQAPLRHFAAPQGPVTVVRFSANGESIGALSGDGTAHRFSLRGAEAQTSKVQSEGARAVPQAMSPDLNYFAFALGFEKLVLGEFPRGEAPGKTFTYEPVSARGARAAFARGRFAYSADNGRLVVHEIPHLLTAPTRGITCLNEAEQLRGLWLSDDGQRLLAASDQGELSYYEVSAPRSELNAPFKLHERSSLGVSADLRTLIVGSRESVAVFRAPQATVPANELLARLMEEALAGKRYEQLEAVAALLAESAGSADAARREAALPLVQVFLKRWQEAGAKSEHQGALGELSARNKDSGLGKLLVLRGETASAGRGSGSSPPAGQTTETTSPSAPTQLVYSPVLEVPSGSGRLSFAAISRGGRHAVTLNNDGECIVFDTVTGRMKNKIRERVRAAGEQISGAALSADGAFLVVGWSTGAARVWELETREMIFEYLPVAKPVRHVSISDDGAFFCALIEGKFHRVPFRGGKAAIEPRQPSEGAIWGSVSPDARSYAVSYTTRLSIGSFPGLLLPAEAVSIPSVAVGMGHVSVGNRRLAFTDSRGRIALMTIPHLNTTNEPPAAAITNFFSLKGLWLSTDEMRVLAMAGSVGEEGRLQFVDFADPYEHHYAQIKFRLRPDVCMAVASDLKTIIVAGDGVATIYRCEALPETPAARFARTANRMLVDRQFERLDEFAARFAQEKTPFAWNTRESRFGALLETLATFSDPSLPDAGRTAVFRAWVTERPNSKLARLLLARQLIADAWRARGGGVAATVSASGWRAFNTLIAEAHETLEPLFQGIETPREVYAPWFVVARAQSWSRERCDPYVDQLLLQAPDYVSPHVQMIEKLLPRWGGKPQEAEEYARIVSGKLGGKRGDMMYARIAVALRVNHPEEEQLTLADFDYDRIQRGLRLILEQSPGDAEALSAILCLAHARKDKENARFAVEQITDPSNFRWTRGLFMATSHFASVYRWARRP